MANPYFRFKQFTVFHDRCAMKVGTDGVILGSWAIIKDTDKVLDVGAGSGLIALMLGQRNNNAKIDCIEIDKDAAEQSNENINASLFSNISPCENISLQDFAAKNTSQYDLIISNPPFFLRSLKSPDKQRSTARHSDSLPIEDFITLSAGLLNEKGRLNFIYPVSEREYLLSLIKANGLFVTRITNVRPTPGSEIKRLLLEVSKEPGILEETDIIIENSRHSYSLQFTVLLKDFYLKF